ncbi:hypothetical protein CBM2604_B60224 [Cupriavidus taiwanensis]|nr:hypothetical protein CBM2604_B60224 [Cupriavidus taiwanensis]SOZ48595.1 hypothetical protein CBM2610_B50224 [Cupriavidus taiwanensis]
MVRGGKQRASARGATASILVHLAWDMGRRPIPSNRTEVRDEDRCDWRYRTDRQQGRGPACRAGP